MDERAKMVLASTGMCALATSSNDQPWVSLMAYVFEPEADAVLMITPAGTRKTQHLRDNPQVALLVDTRRDEAAAREGIMALSAEGCAEVLDGEAAEPIRRQVLAKHPQLSGLAAGETSAVRITVGSHQLLTGPTSVVSRRFPES
jgi:nitroimidazol reductase NimA-like FMN-containing flavoprotein (pyridoxamine 5'-phosphate oxidase superfamily)